MSDSESKPAAAVDENFTKTWRYKLGFLMIVGGNLGIVVCITVLPMLGVGAGTVGALVVGGEVISLASIAFLGKEGFKAIKSKFTGAIKAGYTGAVSRARHRIGILLLLTHVVTSYIIVTLLWIIIERTTPETPFPEVFGMNFELQDSTLFTLFLIGEISFLVSIYVLGADWWDKFRSIFVWEGQGRT